MKFEYMTTIVELHDLKIKQIKVNPPDDSGWSLLSMVASPNGLTLFYNWAKQKPLSQFTSSDNDFEKSLNLVQSLNQQEEVSTKK